MKNISIIFLLFVLTIFTANGQFKNIKLSFIEIDAGPKYSLSQQLTDICGGCFNVVKDDSQKLPKPSMMYGINLGFNIQSNIIIETGIAHNAYTNRLYFDYQNEKYYLKYLNYKLLQIPLRIKSYVNIYKHRLFIIPSIGISTIKFWRSKESFSNHSGKGFIPTNYQNKLLPNLPNDTIYYSYNLYLDNINKPLLETSIGFEALIKKNLAFNLTVNYMTGFSEIGSLYINYTTSSNSPTAHVGRLSTNGNNINLILGLKYFFSHHY